jgi:hypothetical protein
MSTTLSRKVDTAAIVLLTAKPWLETTALVDALWARQLRVSVEEVVDTVRRLRHQGRVPWRTDRPAMPEPIPPRAVAQ